MSEKELFGADAPGGLTPQQKRDVYQIVRYAVEQATEHKCLFGLTEADRDMVNAVFAIAKEHPPKEMRENHDFISKMRKVSNKVGVAVVTFVFLTGTGGILALVWKAVQGGKE